VLKAFANIKGKQKTITSRYKKVTRINMAVLPQADNRITFSYCTLRTGALSPVVFLALSNIVYFVLFHIAPIRKLSISSTPYVLSPLKKRD